MAERISSLLRRSVGHLEDEVPESCRLLRTALGPMVVEIDVDGEIFALRGGSRITVTDGPAPDARTRISSSRAAILDLLDARVALTQAVEAGLVSVRGSLDDVQRAHEALMAYLHATVRAPAQPALLGELRIGL